MHRLLTVTKEPCLFSEDKLSKTWMAVKAVFRKYSIRKYTVYTVINLGINIYVIIQLKSLIHAGKILYTHNKLRNIFAKEFQSM